YYPYTIELDPYDYVFNAGSQIGLMVFGSDPDYSPLYDADCIPEFDIAIGPESYAVLPLLLDEPTAPVGITIESATVRPGDTVEITYGITDNEYGFSVLDVDIPYASGIYNPLVISAAGILNDEALNYSFSNGLLNINFVAEDNIAGDGALFTVTYQMEKNAPYSFKIPLSLQVNALQFSSFMDKLSDVDTQVQAGYIRTYDHNVYLKTSATDLVEGDTLLVDVILVGGLNYTQISTEISYDNSFLDFTGYSDLQGWVAAVSPLQPNKVSVRSVPSANMLYGEPCLADIKIVTLKFTVKSAPEDIKSAIGFSSLVVTPAASVVGALTAPGQDVPIKYYSPFLTTANADFLKLLDYDHVDYLAKYLSKDIGNRYTASFRRDMTVDWLIDELESYGYEPYVHSFNNATTYYNGSFEVFGTKYMYFGPAYNATTVYRYNSRAELELTGAAVLNWANSSNALAVPTGADYEGQAVLVTLNGTAAPSAANYYNASLALQNAGAGAVLFQMFPEAANGNTSYSRIANTTSGTAITIPVGYTLNYETKGIVGLLDDETEVKITMYSDNTGKNVVAELPSASGTQKTVYITSHHDSMTSGPGTNDNGSGTVMTLEMARAFKDVDFAYNLVFIIFDAEETGLRGAYAYCADMSQEERANFVANYNMDMIATSQANCEWMFMNISDSRLQTMQNQIPTGNNNALADNPAAVTVAKEYGIYNTTMLAAKKMNFENILFCYDTTTDHYAFVRYGNGGYDNHRNMMNAVEYDWRSNRRGTGFETLYHKVGDTYELNWSIERCKTQADIISLAIYYAANGAW
ncbi:MAG: M28 family peptidase, partial [Firmicutes bacterium]|nr:M28 family peptidase [Bacillota bacterium]